MTKNNRSLHEKIAIYASVITNIFAKIRSAKNQLQSYPRSVSLLIVSKNQLVEVIETLVILEKKSFGDSYLQAVLEKIKLLEQFCFISKIQSNKTCGCWVYSIDQLEITQR